MHFIVGHPRSGTHLLTDLLNAAGPKIAMHEAYRVPTAIRVDASWKNTWVLPVLLELYPEARVLHLMRDPRRNVIACHNMGYYGRMEPHPRFTSLHRWLQAMPAVRRPDWNSLGMFGRNCAFWVESHRLILQWRSALADRYSAVRLEDMHDPAATARIFDFLGLARPTSLFSRRNWGELVYFRLNTIF